MIDNFNTDLAKMEIVFLALITAFILFRLFKVLGTIDEDEQNQNFQEFDDLLNEIKKEEQAAENEIHVADAFEAALPTEVRDQFDKFREIDPNFKAYALFEKSKKAFEIIVVALNSHDLKTLKPLLSDKVYKVFSEEIKKRKKQGIKSNIKILQHKDSAIESASFVKGSVARVTIRFNTEQSIEDSANHSEIVHIEDTWTFEKDLQNQKNPIWKLIAT